MAIIFEDDFSEANSYQSDHTEFLSMIVSFNWLQSLHFIILTAVSSSFLMSECYCFTFCFTFSCISDARLFQVQARLWPSWNPTQVVDVIIKSVILATFTKSDVQIDTVFTVCLITMTPDTSNFILATILRAALCYSPFWIDCQLDK